MPRYGPDKLLDVNTLDFSKFIPPMPQIPPLDASSLQPKFIEFGVMDNPSLDRFAVDTFG